LNEKEVLLREIHHRVKNNMQVISSLLSLQAQKIENQHDLELFQESQNRIHTMAMVHEKLYHAEDMARINFKDFTIDLVAHLFRFYSVDPSRIKKRVDVQNVFLTVDQAIPCAQIINELVSNSLKHAFPDGMSGEISITFKQENGGPYFLRVRDTGKGLPEKLDYQNTSTLGMRIVNALTQQLQSTLELSRKEGTCFILTFYPEEEE
jgi:two-component sensor histidine kinase